MDIVRKLYDCVLVYQAFEHPDIRETPYSRFKTPKGRRENIMKNTETFDFRDFMKGELRTKQCKQRDLKLYSLYFNPLALFDPTFILIGAGVVLVAIGEKFLADNGFVFVASALSSILRLALPVVAAGSLIYLISHSSFLLW